MSLDQLNTSHDCRICQTLFLSSANVATLSKLDDVDVKQFIDRALQYNTEPQRNSDESLGSLQENHVMNCDWEPSSTCTVVKPNSTDFTFEHIGGTTACKDEVTAVDSVSVKECSLSANRVELEHGEIIKFDGDLLSAKFESDLNMNNIDTKYPSNSGEMHIECFSLSDDDLNTSDVNGDLDHFDKVLATVKNPVRHTDSNKNEDVRCTGKKCGITNRPCACKECGITNGLCECKECGITNGPCVCKECGITNGPCVCKKSDTINESCLGKDSRITNKTSESDDVKNHDNCSVSLQNSLVKTVEEKMDEDLSVVKRPGDNRMVYRRVFDVPNRIHKSESDPIGKDLKFQSSQKYDESLTGEDLDCVSELEMSDIPLTQSIDYLTADICSNKTRCDTPQVFNGFVSKQRHIRQIIRRVPISSRVDVILSNDLFRKHLTKYDHGLFAYQKSEWLMPGISNETLSNSIEINDIPFLDILNTKCTRSMAALDTQDILPPAVQNTIRKETNTSEQDESDIENLANHCENNGPNIFQSNQSELSSCKTLPKSHKPKILLRSRNKVHIPTYEEFRNVRKSKTMENLNVIANADDFEKSRTRLWKHLNNSSVAKSSSTTSGSSATESNSEINSRLATAASKKINNPMLDTSMEILPGPIQKNVPNASPEKNYNKETCDGISALEEVKKEIISAKSLECVKSDSGQTSDTAKRKPGINDPGGDFNGDHLINAPNQSLESSSNIGHPNLPNLSDVSIQDLQSEDFQNVFLEDKTGKADTSIDMGSMCNSSLQLSDIAASPCMLVESEDDGFCFEKNDSKMADKDSSKDNNNAEETTQIPIARSTSDVSDLTGNNKRRKRGRKMRPYKSDPFTGSRPVQSDAGNHTRGNSDDLKEASLSSPQASLQSLEELSEEDVDADSERKLRNRLSNVSVASTDSGVIGQEGIQEVTFNPHSSSLSHSATTISLESQTSFDKDCECVMCCVGIQSEGSESLVTENVICERCQQKFIQRKETIQEIVATEISYGRDLNILKQEFYEPMKTNGLMTAEQLETIFSNLDELSHVNLQFVEKIESAIHQAYAQEDQSMNTVNIGSLFLESSTMFLTFESYCVNQAQAPVLLEQLEKEKELLRIFLLVSQTENSLLRRMHLKSFLMVPVQRIMKYPLLMERLYKCTPKFHPDRDNVHEAKDKIEEILEHINAKTKGSIKLKRKGTELRKISMTEKIEVNRVALEILGWKRKDVCDIVTSRLWMAVPQDHTWIAKKGKNLKFSPVHAVLLTLGQARLLRTSEDQLLFPKSTDVREAAVILIREKNGKFQPVRDPFHLEKCVVTAEAEVDDVFELMEWNKEAYLLKAEDIRETKMWVQHLKQLTSDLSMWRRRRNGQANIMIQYVP